MQLLEGKYDQLTGNIVDALWFIIKKSKEFYDKTGEPIYATKFLNIEGIIGFKYRVIIKREEETGSYSLSANTFNNRGHKGHKDLYFLHSK